MVASVLPSRYFSAKLGLANGLIKFAGGVGGTVLSIGLDNLILNLGTAWTFRVVGICCLATGIPIAPLVKEVNPVQGQASFVDFSLFRNWSFSCIFRWLNGCVCALCSTVFLAAICAVFRSFFESWGLYRSGFQFVRSVGKAEKRRFV